MSGSGWDAVSVVRAWSEDTSGCPVVVVVSPGCPGEVGRPSRMSGRGRETLPDVSERWEVLLDVWEWQGSLPEVRE